MLRDQLEEIAFDAGCVGFGVTAADPLNGVAEAMRQRKVDGFAADLAFTYRDPDVAADVRRSLPWAERLISVAFAYEPAAGVARSHPGAHRIARFADGEH